MPTDSAKILEQSIWLTLPALVYFRGCATFDKVTEFMHENLGRDSDDQVIEAGLKIKPARYTAPKVVFLTILLSLPAWVYPFAKDTQLERILINLSLAAFFSSFALPSAQIDPIYTKNPVLFLAKWIPSTVGLAIKTTILIFILGLVLRLAGC